MRQVVDVHAIQVLTESLQFIEGVPIATFVVMESRNRFR